MKSTLAQSKPPQQKRSRRTLTRIVDAGLAILGERGVEGLTVQDVVARSGTSVGSFYQRFAGKDELLRHLEAELEARSRGRFAEALAARGEDTRSLAASVEAIVALRVQERGAAHPGDDAHEDVVLAELLERKSEIRHPDPETAIRVGYAAVRGAVRVDRAHDDATLARELTRLWLSYLGAGETEPPKGGSVDFFDVWA